MDFAQMMKEERARARQKSTSPTLTPIPTPTPPEPSIASQEQLHKEHVDEKNKHLIFPLESKSSIPTPISSPHVQGIRYYTNFLTHDDAQSLYSAVHSCREDRWITLPTTGRRLQQWGGMPGARNHVERGPFPLPSYQEMLCRHLIDVQVFDKDKCPPNHVLINAYSPGQGILPHKDGPAYYPRVAILSVCFYIIILYDSYTYFLAIPGILIPGFTVFSILY
mgnify:CR=1 FL=1|jgi:hypothetical protein